MDNFFGKYQVKKEIGRGAMGSVYLAYDAVLEREVAIKTISSAIREDHLKERFIREARAAGKLRHHNIVTIYDFGVEENQLYIVMEYLEGVDLSELVAERRQMDIKEKLEIVRQICLGLNFAHENKVYHRDIKPANVRLLDDGTVKIVDFGLAVVQTSSLTQTGSFLGTPNYIAPERLHGKSGDGKSDQFAVGILLYEILTYSRAFGGDTVPTVINNVLNSEPRELEPKMMAQFPELGVIIGRSISKDPALRYPTMKDMANDIETLLARMKTKQFSLDRTVTITEGPMDVSPEAIKTDQLLQTELSQTFEKEKRKSPKMAVAAVAVILVVLALLYFVVLNPKPETPDSAIAAGTGSLAFDVKPYAVIQKVVDVKTGKNLLPQLNAGNATTPLRLTLPTGEYEIVYSNPQWNGKTRGVKVTITKDQTVHQSDQVSEQFIEDATKHFSIPLNTD